MWRNQAICVLLIAAVAPGCACLGGLRGQEKLVLARECGSAYAIVIADDASPSTRYGALELQRYVKEMTGAELPIRSDREPLGANEVILGDNAHLRALETAVDFEALGSEGYIIRTVGPHLVIAGGDLRGNLYGVYGLLEDHFGCKWFTPEVSRIPQYQRLALPALDETKTPVLEYREPFTIDCFDGDWCARNRMNSSTGRIEEKHGGKVRFGAGLFVHTFNVLMPPDTYFAEHPEYYSEIDGKRVKDRTQLCCTNPDVVRICTEELLKRIAADPDAYVYSVSQNDWLNYCECARCTALAEAEGSQMAPLLQLVNAVAEAVEKQYPDKAIETLAYQYTRKPPRTMRPRPNVIIRLCSIECCFMHPLDGCDLPENRAFVEDIEGWAKVADRLWIWDYVTSFRHFMTPFPNLHVRDDNIQLFVRNNVTGIFEQDNYISLNGELSGLSGYLNAKLLWDPGYGEDRAIDEFLEGVYCDAAAPIAKYIDLLRNKVTKDNIHCDIWIGPHSSPFLTPEVMAESEKLWDEAEAAVASQAAVLERVRVARLCHDYAWIELNQGTGFGAYEVDHANFTAVPRPEFGARVQRFFEVARKAGVSRMAEGGLSLDEYQEEYAPIFAREAQTFTPLQSVDVAVTPGVDYAYYEADAEWNTLPDFGAITPAKTGVHDRLDLGPRGRDDEFGMRFTGFFKAPEDGIYAFTVQSNDGARLRIGETFVVDNDGLHDMSQERMGLVGLKTGLHPIEVVYFQAGNKHGLRVFCEGPGVERTQVPADLLFHAGS